MPSTLTPRVFRRLLSSQPFHFRCPHHLARRLRPNSASHPIRQGSRPIPLSSTPTRPLSRRTFLNFSRRPKQSVPKEPDIPPGLSEFIDLNKAMHLSHRPAPPDEIRDAMGAWIDFKVRKGVGCTDIECDQVLGAFRYLRANRGVLGVGVGVGVGVGEEGNGIGRGKGNDGEGGMEEGKEALLGKVRYMSDLMGVLRVLPNGAMGVAHALLAREVWGEVEERRELYELKRGDFLRSYCGILSVTGGSAEIAKLMRQLEESNEKVERRGETAIEMWRYAVEGFKIENNEAGFLDALERVGDEATKYQSLVQFYAKMDDVENTKMWYAKCVEVMGIPGDETLKMVLKFADRNGEKEWGKGIFRDVIDNADLSKEQWDVVLEWAVESMGKSAEDIERMMGVMERQDDPGAEGKIRPDIKTINKLVAIAAAKNDSYLAERLIALGIKNGIEPNLETLILQLEYRSAAGDMSGAHTAYQALQSEEILQGEDLPAVNKYLRALCSSNTDQYERILSIAKDMSDRDVRLEPSTVTSLCAIYLTHSQLEDVLSLLQVHIFTFTSTDRKNTIPVFLKFILDPSTDEQTAWDSYNILRTFFSELSITTRTQLMNNWFLRKRPDMAIHTFGHMRGHELPEFRPTMESYLSAFEGISQIRPPDEESLALVHNMLKLDVTINPCTKLWNSLMLAYNSINKPFRALQFWDEITNSEEGPDYRSLEIVFSVWAKKQFGYLRGKELWQRMRRMEIEISRRVFAQYLGCLAGGFMLGEVKTLLVQLQEGKVEGVTGGWGVDGFMCVLSSSAAISLFHYLLCMPLSMLGIISPFPYPFFLFHQSLSLSLPQKPDTTNISPTNTHQPRNSLQHAPSLRPPTRLRRLGQAIPP